MADAAVAPKSRYPLAETTNRVNSAVAALDQNAQKHSHDQVRVATAVEISRVQPNGQGIRPDLRVTSAPARQVAQEPHPSTVLRPPQEHDDAKRNSQASYASTSSSRSKKNYKTQVGPWQLGKTLGKGSSARVQLCRHSVTNQLAAVKIVNRRMAYLVQDSSLAALSKWDSSLPEPGNGEMRVPMAIEREVAILKLIEHPNIMKLYDIWENRSEIYLILEYVDQGDLFTFINCKGRMAEDLALCFFRQIISAIMYCHSFNICHRDLKPENILITSDLQIKIADFGMAALHQTDSHQLATACGSPHYAAPELLKNRQYRGDRADIWSLGVILYAMLSASLPFDDPDLRVMMSKAKKGHYEMPKGLSPEAMDLIRRMLQVNPERRITLKEIWRHPLVQKYSYLDNFNEWNAQPPDLRRGFQHNPVPRRDIDPQLLRQLRSLWHMFSENELAQKLCCDEPNDQKAFYWLLYNYREQQLEDFKPELAHSMSDYHHLQPGSWKKRISTCQFAQPRSDGHGRSISRFTVISNAAETEADTVQSYDPYRGSRVLRSCDSQVSHTKIIVHRDSLSGSGIHAAPPSRGRSGSMTHRKRANSTKTSISARPPSSRGSMTSLRSSRPGTAHPRGPSLRHKRGVDFSHIRKRSTSTGQIGRAPSRQSSHPEDLSTAKRQSPKSRSTSPELPKTANGVRPKAKGAPASRNASRDASVLFNEELRHFSSNIAKDCDDAFRSSIVEVESVAGSSNGSDKKQRDVTPWSLTLVNSPDSTVISETSTRPWDSRPLPPLPSDITLPSSPGGASTPKIGDNSWSKDDTRRVGVSSLLSVDQGDRRIVSAPVAGQIGRKPSALPSINEDNAVNGVYDKNRIVSAPPQTPYKRPNETNRSMEYLSKVENTIRVVNSPSGLSPVKMPKPLNVRKKLSTNGTAINGRQSRAGQTEGRTSDVYMSGADGDKKKKTSWFKRSSKSDSDNGTIIDVPGEHSTTSSVRRPSDQTTLVNGIAKKKTLSFPFWKSNKQRDSVMSIGDDDEELQDHRAMRPAWHKSSSGSNRSIDVKQNWLARLFRVKPATSYLCLTMSRRRARQEVAILLREWRKYGIKGIQVDKERNIVFARIGAKNYLRLREVSFAAEVMQVIEHGNKQPLSIIRFTQERGAASSFHRVVDTMKVMFESRNLTVTDKRKQKMMIKTLNAGLQ